MKIAFPLVFVSLLLFVLSCSTRTGSQAGPTRSLGEYFSDQFPSDQPGGSVLVLKHDSIVYASGFGLADLTTRDSITPKTLFNLGSISKTFVANAILILQEQGKLSVEDSLIKFFPDFKNKSIASRVKIKHLLTHTSGLPDNREVSKDSVFYLTARDAENWYPVTQTDVLNFEPGSRFEYSNPAYNGLALIVEQVGGMKWQKFIEERIFIPSGMTTSTITDGPLPQSGVAHGYVYNHGQWTEDDYGEEPTFPAAGNGGVWSSVEELALYEKALRKNVFLKEATIKDSRTIKTFSNWSDATPPFIGWSWFIEQRADSVSVIGHEGSQGGFLCSYVTVPDKDILIVILTNTPRDENAFVDKIMQWLKKSDWLESMSQ